MSFVQVNSLSIHYGKFKAVKNLNLSIPKGEVFGFIGPNGAGKTSTIKVLATLLKPTKGYAFIDGVRVDEDPRRIRRMIGYVPDFFGVYEDLTVKEYLHFFAAAYRLDRSTREATVNDVLILTDLSHKLNDQVDALSRGMKQRLSLARVLLHDPDLLLLDEPASGLDPRARIEMRELLKELKNMGKTIIISSHILQELSYLCTRIGIIEAGRLVVEGSLDDIYKQLQLSRIVHARFIDPQPEQLNAVRQIDGVESLEEQADRFVIKLHEDRLMAEDLLERMIGMGVRVRMYQPEAMDMETAFMKLTEGKVA
jgi:ABC-2 type transport system ATP-binding protein